MADEPYHVVCPVCGSPNVSIDASARWNFDTQEWEISGIFDERTCDDCSYQSHSFKAVRPEDLTPAQRTVIDNGEDYQP